ncbi:AI-2E family transporter [Stutzerimonas stutzeri]|nr:AI-2E family transporter [Stutzerimonas stutzeri]
MSEPTSADDNKQVANRAMVQAAVLATVVLLCIVAWLAFDFLLLLFASILFGVLIHGVSQWLGCRTPLSYKASMGLFFVVTLLGLGGAGWLVAPSIAEQADALSDSLPEAVERLRERAQQLPWTNELLQQRERIEDSLPDGSSAFSVVSKVMGSVAGALSSFVIAFAIGVCLAINPPIYVCGLLKLVPLSYRSRAAEVLDESGATLRAWLLAKLLEMLLIGVLTTLGLWLLGIELALVLGLIAGLLSFIPNIGPVLAVIPALLLASLEGGRTVLYVAALYLFVQALENYVFTPWMQQRIVSVPPALTIGVQLLFGLLAGTLGLLLATPLAAVGMVLVRMLYVEDLLGDRPQAADGPGD